MVSLPLLTGSLPFWGLNASAADHLVPEVAEGQRTIAAEGPQHAGVGC
jgi:hypothetical protein